MRAKPGCLFVSLLLAFTGSFARAQSCDAFPDFALSPATLNTNPGAEYSEWARAYQGMPSIERMRNGRLWAAWTSGGVNEGPDNYVVMVTSTDDGRTWSRPAMVVDPPGNVAAFVPILWRDPDDRLWLFWNQAYGAWWDGRGGAWGAVATQADTERPSWGGPGRIADGWPGGKPIVSRSDDWLLPVFVFHGASNLGDENEHYRLGLTPCVVEALSHDLGRLKGANVYRSTDGGLNWQFLGQANKPLESTPLADRDLVEHLVVERTDGSLWMLMRTPPGIAQSLSVDGGETWSVVEDSGIRHPLSRFFIRRLRSGRLLLIRHEPPAVDYPDDCDDCGERNRSHLTAYLSADDGKTWEGGLLIDARETVSYPDAVESEDGRIFAVYDRNRYSDREIWMAVFTEDDVLSGSCASYDCRLRVPLSRP